MAFFTSPRADYKACWPVSEVAPPLSPKALHRTDLHLFQGCLLLAEVSSSAGRQASLIESDNNFAWKRPLKVKDGWSESEVRCLQDVSVS